MTICDFCRSELMRPATTPGISTPDWNSKVRVVMGSVGEPAYNPDYSEVIDLCSSCKEKFRLKLSSLVHELKHPPRQ